MDYYKIGLYTGGAAALFWIIKPSSMFDEKGQPRPFSFSANSDAATTFLPWYFASPLLGLIATTMF